MLSSAVAMLPTPQARDWKGAGPADGNRNDPNLSAITALLPTPTSSDAKASGSAGYGGNEFCTLTDATVRGKGGMPLLPTPSVADVMGGRKARSGERNDEPLLNGIAAGDLWGDYAAAISRWESCLGCVAPAPTMTSARGNPQLSPRFVEWLMGLPAGWVTDTPGITRNEALKALGNGVVPQQAAEALRVMASWSEVAA